MKGQIRFDEFMNTYEEQPQEVQYRPPMVDPCYYCLCRTCMNNAESRTVSPDEVPYDWNPCFFCDECVRFDGESESDMERLECSRYVIDNYNAAKNRERFRMISKGESNGKTFKEIRLRKEVDCRK